MSTGRSTARAVLLSTRVGVLDQCRGHASFVLHPLAPSPSPPPPYAFLSFCFSTLFAVFNLAPRKIQSWNTRAACTVKIVGRFHEIRPLWNWNWNWRIQLLLLSQTGFSKKGSLEDRYHRNYKFDPTFRSIPSPPSIKILYTFLRCSLSLRLKYNNTK